jgi:hypothetical protein
MENPELVLMHQYLPQAFPQTINLPTLELSVINTQQTPITAVGPRVACQNPPNKTPYSK